MNDGPSVLVVEDDPVLGPALMQRLRLEGFRPRLAASGAAAVEACTAEKPDLVILDVMLPDLDGFAVIEKIRGEGIDTPVVFLSARDEVDDRLTGLRLGGDDYVTKPFNLDEVIDRILPIMNDVATVDGLPRRVVLEGAGEGAHRGRGPV